MFLVLPFSAIINPPFPRLSQAYCFLQKYTPRAIYRRFFQQYFYTAALHITTPDKIAIALVILLDLDRVETAPTAHSLTCPVTRGCGRVPL